MPPIVAGSFSADRDAPSPVFPMTVTSTITPTTATASAQIRFRPQDAGTTGSIFVFAYAPAARVRSMAEPTAKADGDCVLSQLTPSGHIRVNRVARTSIPNIYAAGDCSDLLPLASVASMQGRTAVFHAMGDAVNPIELRNVTSNIFTQPEIATVGWNQKQIEEGIARSPNQKLLMLPVEASSVIGAIGGIAEIAKEAFGDGGGRTPGAQRPPSSRPPSTGQ